MARVEYQRKIESLQSKVDAQDDLRQADREKHLDELREAQIGFERELQAQRER